MLDLDDGQNPLTYLSASGVVASDVGGGVEIPRRPQQTVWVVYVVPSFLISKEITQQIIVISDRHEGGTAGSNP